MRSQTLNASRYSNGTLAKIMAETTNFVSYDYKPETNTGTFNPATTRLTPSFSGGITLGGWEYLDGETWKPVVGGDHGFVFSGSALVVSASSDLFGSADAVLTIRLVGSDPEYWDSVTLTREVSPTELYRKTNTKITQTDDKIALIASSEELAKYSTTETLSKNLSTLEQTSKEFRQTVTGSYATKTYANGQASAAQTAAISAAATDATAKANAAETAAKNYTTNELTKYSTITQTDSKIETAVSTKVGEDEVKSIIKQEADSIRLKADKIAWESDNSSMTQDGTLTCHNANLDGNITITGATSESKIGTNDTFVYSDFLGVVKRNLENFHYFIKNGTGGIIDSKSWQKFSNMLQETTVTTGKQILRMLCLANGYDDIDTAPAAYLNEVLERFQYDESKDKYVYSLVAPKSSFHMYDTGIYIGYEGGRKYNVPYNIDSETSQSNATVIMLGERRIRLKAGQSEIVADNSAQIKATDNIVRIQDGNNNHSVYAATIVGSLSKKYSNVILKAEYASIRISGAEDYPYELYNSYSRLYFGENEIQYKSVSSRRYKHDITPELPEDMDPHRLYNLPVVRFTYNDDAPLQYQDTKGKPLIGFIAEDVEEIYPNATVYNEDGEVETWDERRIIPGMLALIQEQKAEIDELRLEIANIKTEMEALKNEIYR